MDLLQAAVAYAKDAHVGQRFKFVAGVYYDHVKDVSRGMDSNDEKFVAFLHDVVEWRVKERLGSLKIDEFNKLSRRDQRAIIDQEEKCIDEILREITRHFDKVCGIDVTREALALNIITKRRWEPYRIYIQRLARQARSENCLVVIKVKRSDLRDNSSPARNPAPRLQTEKDKIRLGNYAWADGFLDSEFPRQQLKYLEPRKLRTLEHKGRPGKPKQRQRGISQAGIKQLATPEYD